MKGNKEVAGLLVAYGADVNTEENDGRTSLRWAEYRKNQDLIALLRQHGGHE